MEVASRPGSKRLLNGLAKCIEKDAQLSLSEQNPWQMTKDRGHRLFDPKRGGSYAVFDQRPLSPEMRNYCVQDVVHMPALLRHYKARLGDAWLPKVQEETAARIALSRNSYFRGKGRHMAEAPAGWEYWRPGGA